MATPCVLQGSSQLALNAIHQVIANPKVGFVSFTGSVASGRTVYQTVASRRFIDVTLELGGKDPAYLCEDADFDAAVATIVDGACYNAGQSCCAIERVYVHKYVTCSILPARAVCTFVSPYWFLSQVIV
jgi:acyl-CoA reductase-like NAD-dependent aldehyde dehydrogenase